MCWITYYIWVELNLLGLGVGIHRASVFFHHTRIYRNTNSPLYHLINTPGLNSTFYLVNKTQRTKKDQEIKAEAYSSYHYSINLFSADVEMLALEIIMTFHNIQAYQKNNTWFRDFFCFLILHSGLAYICKPLFTKCQWKKLERILKWE